MVVIPVKEIGLLYVLLIFRGVVVVSRILYRGWSPHRFEPGWVQAHRIIILNICYPSCSCCKVRLQTSTTRTSVMSAAFSFGGIGSLFRGMGAPLSSAAVVNALIFSSYGISSRFYDQQISNANTSKAEFSFDDEYTTGESVLKSFLCGSFAGFVQCGIICPMEHIKVCQYFKLIWTRCELNVSLDLHVCIMFLTLTWSLPSSSVVFKSNTEEAQPTIYSKDPCIVQLPFFDHMAYPVYSEAGGRPVFG
jgi:hypothetical protein